MTVHHSDSEADTIATGQRLGASLGDEGVVLLSGGLGAGKTAFVRGLARALACPDDAVASPTFAIVHEYRGRVLLRHVDLYRLTPAEVEDLGLDDLTGEGVMAVEWSERWPRPPADAWRVTIESVGGDRRRITVEPPPGYSTR